MSKPQRDDPRPTDRDEVTEASMESFPASDPPAFNASPPQRRRKKARRGAAPAPVRADANGAKPVELATAEQRERDIRRTERDAPLLGERSSGRNMLLIVVAIAVLIALLWWLAP